MVEAAPAAPAPGARRIRDYFRRYQAPFLAGSAALVVTNLLALSIPWLLKSAIDALEGGTGEGVSAAGRYALWMAAAAALMAIVRTLSRILIFNSGRKVEYDLRSELFDHLSTLPPSYFAEVSVGDVMSRAVNDLGQVRLTLGPGILNGINTTVAYAVGLSLMLAIDPWLTLAALAPYPLLLLVVRKFAWRLFKHSRAVQESLGGLSTFIQENLAGQSVVKSYVREDAAVAAFRDRNDELLGHSLRLAATRGTMVPVFGILGGIGTLVVLWMGGIRVIEGHLSLGSLVAFNGYLAHLAWPTIALGWMLSVWQRGFAAMERINDIFRAEPAIRDIDPEPIETLRGEIEVRRLTVRHPGASVEALAGVSFRIAAGGSLGVVGATGSGKSTLVDLLPRLQEVPEGAVFVDGVDVRRVPLKTLRSAIGYAPQDPFLFSATIADNIAFARPDATRADIERAARLAAIHDDIALLPHGYQTLVGERGVTLSGGQRQRVALARAILKEPAILVLDDSLSSVDADTEARILGSLDEVLRARTSIIVSHRLVAVQRCDHIIVLDEGRVAQEGTHEALVRAPGLYRELWRRQRLEAELEHSPAEPTGPAKAEDAHAP